MRRTPGGAIRAALRNGDTQTSRVCSASGLTYEALAGKIRHLDSLIVSLDLSIADAERAERDAVFYGRVTSLLQVVVAGSDLFLEVAAAPLPGYGKAVVFVHSQKDTLAELSQGKVDYAKITTRLVGQAGVAGKVVSGQANLVIDAYRKELTAKQVLLESISRQAEYVALALKEAGEGKRAAVVTKGVALIQAGAAIADALLAGSGAEGIRAAKTTAMALSKRYKIRLAELNRELKACEPPPVRGSVPFRLP